MLLVTGITGHARRYFLQELINHGYQYPVRCTVRESPLFLRVLPAAILKAVTLGKIDFIERAPQMSEDRSYPHDEATKDFWYAPMPFEEGIQIETQQYLGDKAAS